MDKKNSASLLKAFVFAGTTALALVLPKVASADNLSDALIGAYKSSGLLEQNRALLRIQDENGAIAIRIPRRAAVASTPTS
jgi:outer membrane protein